MKSRSDTPHHSPTSDADDSSARDVRWITVWSTIFILAFLCIAGCRWMLKVNADNQLKVFGDAGYPTTLEQLDAWYYLPDGARNAADLYLKAFDAHDPCEVPFPADSPAAPPPQKRDESNARTNAGKFSFLPPPHSTSGKPQRENICDFVPIISEHTTTELGAEKQPPPETVMAATDIYLERNRQAIDLLHEAATLEHCRYPVDLTLGSRALLPYLSRIRHGARILAIEAFHAGQRGDSPRVREAIIAILRCGESLSEEPILISHLVRLACQAMAVQALQQACENAPLHSADLVKLHDALARVDTLPGIGRAMAGELVVINDAAYSPEAFRFAAHGTHANLRTRFAWTAYVASGLVDMDRAATSRLLKDYTEAARLDYSALFAAIDKVDSHREDLPPWYMLTKIMLPNMAAVFDKTARLDALLRTARTAIAVELFRRSEGRLPANLSDLTPRFPEQPLGDPFDNDIPLTLVKSEEEPAVLVYSLGPDRTDDGGQGQTTGASSKGDIVFTFPIPPTDAPSPGAGTETP